MTEPSPNQQDESEKSGVPNPLIEQQIRLEEARRASLEAEKLNAKQAERNARAANRRKLATSIPITTWGVIAVVVVLIAIAIPAFIIPALAPAHETTYLVESDLERAVDINSLSTVDYTYRGIVEKKGWFGITDFNVKYEAHVRATFDMSQIRFSIDNNSKTITASLPKPTIEEPEINNESLGYLPEGRDGDMAEVLRLCKEDAATEVAEEGQIEDMAYKNLESTVEALTLPLIGNEYTLTFEHQPETQEELSSNEA